MVAMPPSPDEGNRCAMHSGGIQAEKRSRRRTRCVPAHDVRARARTSGIRRPRSIGLGAGTTGNEK